MVKKQNYIVTALLACALMVMCIPSAHAIMYFDGGAIIECNLAEGLYTGHIVSCVRAAIEPATIIFLAGLTTWIDSWHLVDLAIVIALILFGVRMAAGETEVKKKAFSLVFKIGVVYFLSDNLGGFAPSIFGIMDQAVTVISQQMIGSSYQCPAASLGVVGAVLTSEIWLRIDCMLAHLFGTDSANLLLVSSLFGIIGSLLFTGTFGIMVAFIGLYMLVSIASLAFRTVYVYLLSYMYVGFMIIISPIIIPLFLFNIIQGFFQNWFNNVLAGMIQPAMMVAFMTFAFPLVDQAIFAPNGTSLFSVMQADEIKAAHRNQSQKCSWQVPAQPEFYKNVEGGGLLGGAGGGGNNFIKGPLRNTLTPLLTGATDVCAFTETHSLDLTTDDKTHFERLFEIATAIATALLVVLIVLQLLTLSTQLVSAVVGGGYSLSGALGQGSAIESGLMGMIGGGRSSLMSKVGKSRSPANILGGIPDAIGGAARGLGKGITK